MQGRHRKSPGCFSVLGVVVGGLAMVWVACLVAMINTF